jgi:hypothetical protein
VTIQLTSLGTTAAVSMLCGMLSTHRCHSLSIMRERRTLTHQLSRFAFASHMPAHNTRQQQQQSVSNTTCAALAGPL